MKMKGTPEGGGVEANDGLMKQFQGATRPLEIIGKNCFQRPEQDCCVSIPGSTRGCESSRPWIDAQNLTQYHMGWYPVNQPAAE